MKTNLKKSLCFLLALITISASLLALPFTASAANPSGSNSSIKWEINKDGVLKVTRFPSSGTVKIPDYSLNKRPGWYKYAEQIISIKIGANITRVGNYAFYGLTKVKDITVGKDVSDTGTAPFGRCEALKSFTVADGSKSYKTSSSVLYSSDNATLVAFPANKKVETFEIPSTVSTIKGYAFHYAKNLKEVTQKSSSVKTINTHAFANCELLEKVKLENNCTTIGNKAFYNCKNLKSVTIPPSVTSLGSDIFLPSSEQKKLTVHCAYNSPIHEYLKGKGGYAVTDKTYKFKCTFEPGNGAEVAEKSRTVTWGFEYGALPTPTKTGFSFSGWYLGDKQISKGTKVTTAKEHTLVARYTGKTFTIILNPENGVCDTQSITITYGQPFGSLPEASKVGYEFLGWYTENGERVYTDTIFNDENITVLVARYRKNISVTSGFNIKYKTKKKITLSWNKQDGVTGYEVYQKTGSEQYLNLATVTNNSIVLTLEAKKSYSFKVRAFISESDTTQYGAYSSVVSRPKTFVKKPSITKSVSKSGVLTVKWNNISNAKKYQIYQYKNKKWKKVKTTTATKFYVYTKAKKTYKFKVRAYATVLGHRYYGAFKKVKYRA